MLIEDILDWPLAEGTDIRMAEAVHMRTYPTEHGRGANVTYGIMLELGRREICGVLACPDFGAYHEAPHHRLRHRCVRRQYYDDNQRQSSTILTITAVPRWTEQTHLYDSEHSLLVVEVRGAPISAGGQGTATRGMDEEAYANRLLFTVEQFMEDVTGAMVLKPDLIYMYSQMDYQLMEVGQTRPSPIPEMILQIRLSLQFGTDTVAGMETVQQIHRRLGITAPPFSSAWMVNGVKFEAMGQQARRSNPPHGIFYRQPGNMVMPIPQVIIRDIPANFYRPNLLNLLPAEVLQVLVGYMWISGDMPGYPHWVREASRRSLVLYYSPVPGSTDHGHLPSTLTLIQLGRGAYAPARMEIADDVINMSRMRGRAEPQQLAPIQILTVMDHDGTGTPISAWAGRGSSGNSDAGGTTGRSTRGGREPGGDPYQTPGGRRTTSFDDNQYPPLSGYGATTIDQSAYSPGSGNHGQTSAGQDVQWNTTPTPPPPQPYMQANAFVPDLGAM
jgi:hypothetical protein